MTSVGHNMIKGKRATQTPPKVPVGRLLIWGRTDSMMRAQRTECGRRKASDEMLECSCSCLGNIAARPDHFVNNTPETWLDSGSCHHAAFAGRSWTSSSLKDHRRLSQTSLENYRTPSIHRQLSRKSTKCPIHRPELYGPRSIKLLCKMARPSPAQADLIQLQPRMQTTAQVQT
jgi:hypothetical protein